nr:MAG TPA: hypothetical protein [Caudoviricetes sp.]
MVGDIYKCFSVGGVAPLPNKKTKRLLTKTVDNYIYL